MLITPSKLLSELALHCAELKSFLKKYYCVAFYLRRQQVRLKKKKDTIIKHTLTVELTVTYFLY